MVFATLVLVSSLALFLLYIQTTCQRILRREFNLGRLQSIVKANRLEFQFVSNGIKTYDTRLDYHWARTALNCDYQALIFLLKNATRRSCQDRLLMLYTKALFLALSGMHLLKLNEKRVILNLTVVLQYFAGLLSEKATPVEFGTATG